MIENKSDRATELDHSILLAAVDGDDDLLRSISELFLRMYPAQLSQIQKAIAENSSSELARAVHTLKGSGGYFLTDHALTLIDDLERIAREGDLSSAGKQAVELETEMERVKPEVLRLATEGTVG